MEKTYYVKLKAKTVDISNYITYVFENLNSQNYNDKYIMCVQFPNWDQKTINIEDIGFVNIRYVQAGVSEWYDGEKFNVYKYTNIIFLKFIHEQKKVNNEFLID